MVLVPRKTENKKFQIENNTFGEISRQRNCLGNFGAACNQSPQNSEVYRPKPTQPAFVRMALQSTFPLYRPTQTTKQMQQLKWFFTWV